MAEENKTTPNNETNNLNQTQPTGQQAPLPANAPTIAPNIAAALSYLVPPITGIVFFLIEKDNKFVKFHAFQSIILGIAAFVINRVLIATIILALLAPLLSLGYFAVVLLCIWKAYNNIEYQLPYIGKFAKTQSEK